MKKNIIYFYDRMLHPKGEYYNHIIRYQLYYNGKVIYNKRIVRISEEDFYYDTEDVEQMIEQDIFDTFYKFQH